MHLFRCSIKRKQNKTHIYASSAEARVKCKHEGFCYVENTLLLTANTLGITVNSDQYSVEIPQIPLREPGEEQKSIMFVLIYTVLWSHEWVKYDLLAFYFSKKCDLKRAQRLLLSQNHPFLDRFITPNILSLKKGIKINHIEWFICLAECFKLLTGTESSWQSYLKCEGLSLCNIFLRSLSFFAYKSCGNEICLQVAARDARAGAR